MKIALTIAGSDSGGGAGIQADLKTFHQFGVFGTSVVVAITAQNTRGVRDVHAVPAGTVRSQIDAVVEDLPPAAVKTGMLATSELVRTVTEALREHDLPNYVLDPVMVATSGDRLLDLDAERTMRKLLVPVATVVTPNIEEARILSGVAVDDTDGMEQAGRVLVGDGATAALVKGGHAGGPEVVDVLVTADGVERFTHERLDTTSTHGTGCTLSSAIAAGLARGRALEQAVADALDFVHAAMRSAPGLGHGHGPLNHFAAAPPDDTP
ncbi:MAG: bifunctional hydroxymethylpyrimidine kinase/phosphomethylpyrimidine kinase [Gemmatimonadales bacterium]|jgi:hydroxymethylpyrimidine/phosphomethylpyrimidine kinase